jgi:hypothetical protein
MLKNISRARAVGFWLAAVAVFTTALDANAAISFAPTNKAGFQP